MEFLQDLNDKTVLITGGTGSFGNKLLELVRQADIKEVRIFSRDELKQEEMRVALKDPRVKFYIGDVREYGSVERAVKGVDYVFHAAALKQVPSCEFFPLEAIKTNVLGSENVAAAALEHQIKKAVFLSTDKAVFPINAMGMSKALMEKIVISKARSNPEADTKLCVVRYGNVMCSRGSVIPLFINQIKAGKQLTVTVAEMTRFLLPLSDAVRLVVHAFQKAETGDIMIKKAPACSMLDLATALQNVFDSHQDIKTIGMRHGEKLFETLATGQELLQSEDLDDYIRVEMDKHDLNYGAFVDEGVQNISELQDYTSHNTQQLSVPEIEELLLALPEVRAYL